MTTAAQIVADLRARNAKSRIPVVALWPWLSVATGSAVIQRWICDPHDGWSRALPWQTDADGDLVDVVLPAISTGMQDDIIDALVEMFEDEEEV